MLFSVSNLNDSIRMTLVRGSVAINSTADHDRSLTLGGNYRF
jgi:ferric-dicitrate binding protein FerR (iron transport regulator)